MADTGSQFRTFRMLKPYLDEPTRLTDHRFRIPAGVRQRVLDSYYSFDDRVRRRRLSRPHRHLVLIGTNENRPTAPTAHAGCS